jgi:hypothetical protein
MAGVCLSCHVKARLRGRRTSDMTTLNEQQTTHDLLNDATMWLQYARGVTATLADLIHEADKVDCKHLALSLEAIAAMTLHGTRQLGEARALMSWQAARGVAQVS